MTSPPDWLTWCRAVIPQSDHDPISFPLSSKIAINYRSMKTLYCTLMLVITCTLLEALPLAAQDLVINNVRIIVGNGQLVEQGTILIRSGRIVSAAAGVAVGRSRSPAPPTPVAR